MEPGMPPSPVADRDFVERVAPAESPDLLGRPLLGRWHGKVLLAPKVKGSLEGAPAWWAVVGPAAAIDAAVAPVELNGPAAGTRRHWAAGAAFIVLCVADVAVAPPPPANRKEGAARGSGDC